MTRLAIRLLPVESHDAALGEQRYEARNTELGGFLHDEVHALPA